MREFFGRRFSITLNAEKNLHPADCCDTLAVKEIIRFTPEEMTLILDILKDGKSKEEREQIVAESLGYMEANCDGCTSGLAEMYQAYIDGKKELRDINMEFHAGYVSGEEVPGRRSCPM